MENQEKERIEEELKELWNRYAPYYKGTLFTPSVQKMGRKLLDAIVPCPDGIIHDAGTGIGYWIVPILEKSQAQKIIATDYSEEMLREAERTLKQNSYFKEGKIELRTMDLTKQWPEEKFDAQVFHLVLYYLPYNEWKDILNQAFVSTNPGGYVYSSILLKGFSIKKAGKKYTLGELFGKTLFHLGTLIKALKIVQKMDDFIEKGIIEYPGKEEFIAYHREIGFNPVEIVATFLDGNEITVRAKKPS